MTTETASHKTLAGTLRRALTEVVSVDLRSLAALRIGMALMLLVDLGYVAVDLSVFYSDDGVFPREVLFLQFGRQWGPLPHLYAGSADWQGLLLLIHTAASVLLLLGLFTPLATVACWLLTVSLHARQPIVLQGSDLILRMMLFWMMFLPTGERWSLDAWRSSRGDDGELAEAPPPRIATVASAAVLLQVAFVYWFSALLKNDPEWHTNGTAVYFALSIDYLTTDWGRTLLAHPEICRFLTFTTFYLELLGPFFAFSPIFNGTLRLATIVAFWGFHLAGLMPAMRLGVFPWVSSASWLVFMPGFVWDAFERWLRAPLGALAPLGPWLAERLPSRRATPEAACRPSRAGSVAAAFFLVYILTWNVIGLWVPYAQGAIPRRLRAIGSSLRIDQYWAMFAPRPLRDDGWFVVVGVLRDGAEVDLLHGGGRVRWEKPNMSVSPFRNFRWRAFMSNLWRENLDATRPYFCDYWCRQWNATHAEERHCELVQLYYLLERTEPDYKPPHKEKVLLWSRDCSVPIEEERKQAEHRKR